MPNEAKDTGGPAFPSSGDDYINHPVHGWILREQIGVGNQPGMSLRDYFAAHAIAILRPSVEAMERMRDDGLGPDDVSPLIAKSAYALADAMLAERSKQ